MYFINILSSLQTIRTSHYNFCVLFLFVLCTKNVQLREQPKQNKRDEIIKGVQDSYAMSGEPVDAKATVANARDKAEELKDKILESLGVKKD